jgi:ferredoxin-NADP reductase
MKLTLKEIRPETADVASFVFEPEQPIDWTPGQYLHYNLEHPDADDRGVGRFFTVSSSPHEGHVMLTTRFAGDRGSTFKRALRQLEPGDTIELDRMASGEFVVDDPSQDHLFLAGGIGITPFRAILLDLEKRGEPLNVRLLYANRTEDIAFRDLFDRLEREHPEFSVEYIIEPSLLDADRLQDEIADDRVYWVSGPKPMVDAVQATLEGLGAPTEAIKRDAFPGYD